MKSVRSQIIWHIRKNKLQGKTYARLKRMPAIRKKLGWIKHGSHQLQDLGGCRVILPTVEAVYQLVEAITKEMRHIIRDPHSFTSKTRSYHLLVTFRDKYPSSIHDGRHIEVKLELGFSIRGLRLWRQSDCFSAKI